MGHTVLFFLENRMNNRNALPSEFYAAISEADDDTLVQRRAAVKDVLAFVGGHGNALIEGGIMVDEIDSELLWRKATGTRRRPAKAA